MIEGLIKLLAFQVAGEAIVFALSIPIPGAVVGMALLFAYLVIRGREDADLDTFTSAFLKHLSLFFIPAAVGIMAHLDRIADEWVAIAAALVISTAASVAATAAAVKFLKR
ncbi:MAG TPA: CidA/LrgA family protein [Burkholderiaceae bacterium]|jgi:holin-like protein|nr:CidA/LrgA family protein [Burkholderiaceae bacterium]